MARRTESEEREARNVVARYARRDPSSRDLYSPLKPDVWQTMQERQRALLELLAAYGRSLADLEVLEIGCGAGPNLLELLRLGFDAAKLVGCELLPERAAAARRALPDAVRVIEGDALSLPFESECFDIVYQSTVFTSLLDQTFQQRLAERMWRWLRPGAAILWYDFTVDNPRNADVRGVPISRIRELFPDGEFTSRRVTLAPPISRRVCKIHPGAYTLFNSIPWLRTHVIAWIQKPDR